MALDQFLYDHYESHLGRGTPPTPDRLESQARHYASVFLPLLPEDRTLPVLDVGCGFGHFLHFLKQQGFVAHRGIDTGAAQVELCRQRVTAAVECVQALPFLKAHEGEFGAIVMINVLEHVPDAELVPLLQAILGALRPGGRVLISVPNAACLPTLVTRYADLTHKRLFTEGSLVQILEAVGFVRVAVLPHEMRVIRSYGSRRERLAWRLRDRLVRWLLNEMHVHLMEGSIPKVQTVNVIGVGEKGA